MVRGDVRFAELDPKSWHRAVVVDRPHRSGTNATGARQRVARRVPCQRRPEMNRANSDVEQARTRRYREEIGEVDITELQKWVGKTETQTDQITATPLAAMSATLEMDGRQ